jgi:hypothetical protein
MFEMANNDKPRIITLCGSTRFPEVFALANMNLTLQGYIVIGLSCYGHADEPRGAKFLTSDADENTEAKKLLDKIHLAKIDISDEIYVVNPGMYIGEGTKREIEYAQRQGKVVRWMF